MTANLALLSDHEWSAIGVSAIVSAAAVLVIAGPGIGLGWLLGRRDFRGKSLLEAVVHLPLVLPPVVTGYVLLVALGPRTALGRGLAAVLGHDLAFSRAAAVLAAAVVAFPLLVRPVRLGIELVDVRLEGAARTLGAAPRRVFLSVTLPLALPGILTGLVLAFARALGEFGATITFAGNIPGETRTLPLAVFASSQAPGGDAAAMRLVVISIVVSLAALLASEVLARRVSRRLGATP